MKKLFLYFWKENIVMFLLLLAIGLSELWATLLHAELLNALIALSMERFISAAIFLVSAFSAMLVFTYIQIRYETFLAQQMSTYLRDVIARRLTKVDYEKFHQKKTQSYLSWFVSDIEQIETNAIEPVFSLVKGIIATILAAVALCSMHWLIIAVTVLEVVLLLQLPNLFMGQLGEKTQDVTEANERFSAKVADLLSGYDTLFVFQKFAYLTAQIHHASEYLAQQKRNYTQVFAKAAISGGVGNVISQVSIFVLTGYLSLMGQVTIGSIAATTGLAGTIFNTVANISQSLATIMSTKPLFEKFESLEVSVRSQPCEHGSTTLDSEAVFELQDVSFSYRDKEILNHFSYTFERGKKYILIGESGSGKSTLLNLLAGRLNDYSGELFFHQQKLETLKYQDLYQDLLYIEQQPHIFQASIRENLIFEDRAINETELWAVLKRVKLDEVIQQLPEKLDTVIGDKGNQLSGGQLQRIAIARGLLQQKSILLLDESTSSLDIENAVAIEEQLLQDESLTIIMISHHLQPQVEAFIDTVIRLPYLNE